MLVDLGAIDFTPDWAKKAAGVSTGRLTPERGERAAARPEQDGRAERRQGGENARKGDGKRVKRANFASLRGPFVKPKPLDADIKVLPESKALGTFLRKIQMSHQAYKLKELALFLLDNPEAVLLKVTPRVAAQGGEQAREPQKFFQCKACSQVCASREELVEHAIAEHLGDYYEKKEVEVEPPKGNFNCVAKCGLTGVLLGPPNVHDFNSAIREVIRTKFPGMSEADYRAKIEMVRDPEVVEEWRKGATKKVVFAAKGAGEGAAMLTREQAEAEFKRNILENLMGEPKNLMVTAAVALKSTFKPLVWAVKDALQAERRAPYNMIFALRGAFKHRNLRFFRVNDSHGSEFVHSQELKAFDTAHAVPELARVAEFIAQNPCCTMPEIEAAHPGAAKQVAWLVSTGHAVAFSNGVFSAVEKFPKYGPQWRKKKPAKPAAENEPQPAEQPAPQAEAEAPATEPAPRAAEEACTPPAAEEAQARKEETENESSAELAE